MRKIINKTAATPVDTGAASKNTNSKNITTARSRRPTPKARLTACLASKFWRPIVQAQLERDRAGQSGVGDSPAAARAGAAGGGAS